MHRLKAGQRAPSGSSVTLFHGYGDSRRAVEWFEADDDWLCPETVNGYWYGYETEKELDAKISRYV